MPLTETEKHNRKVQRRVDRKNEKIREKYPLFFNQFKTTFESEEQGILESAWTCEQTFERLSYMTWRAAFEVEIFKRMLVRAGRDDLIYRAYKRYHNFHQDLVMLSDDLNNSISDIIGLAPLVIHSYVEHKTYQVFGHIIKEGALYYE